MVPLAHAQYTTLHRVYSTTVLSILETAFPVYYQQCCLEQILSVIFCVSSFWRLFFETCTAHIDDAVYGIGAEGGVFLASFLLCTLVGG